MPGCKQLWLASRPIKLLMGCAMTLLRPPLLTCSPMTRSRRNMSIKQEASVALQIFLMLLAKKQMSRCSVPRRGVDPAEFLSGTTPSLNRTYSISMRRASSKTGGQVNKAKMGAPLTRMLHSRELSTTARRRSLLPLKRKLLRR